MVRLVDSLPVYRPSLLGTVRAQIEHRQFGEVTEPEPPVQTIAFPPDRHPFVVGPDRRGLARGPVALGRRVVVLGTRPRVVRGLVVVPHHDPRHEGV